MNRQEAKLAAWEKQFRCSAIDMLGRPLGKTPGHFSIKMPKCDGDAHEVWIQRSDIAKSKQEPILTSPCNIVVLTREQHMKMSKEMNRYCMWWLITAYGIIPIQQWLDSLNLKNPVLVEQLLNR